MLPAPPLLPHHPPPQLAGPSSSASTCVRAGNAAEEDVAGGEDGTSNDVFASLMPNLFSRLKHCDETVSEQEFEEIHRLLNVARSEDDGINGKSLVTQSIVHKAQEEMENTPLLSKQHEKAQEGVRGKRSPRMKADYAHGKENASPNNPPQRNKLSRRERSSRITTHRKPFVVDTRSFGSILNDNALGKCQKPQDVHAFWEAADEREASEAIMGKLRGRCEQNGTTSLRRLGLRRKNSQRTTTRLKRFAVELPSGSEQVQSLDQEKLEEEDDAIEESSFTFLSNPEFRDLKQLFEQKIAKNQIQGSKLSSPLYSVQKGMETTYLNGVINEPEEDCEVLSDGKSPLVKCSVDLPNATASTDEAPEFRKQSQAADMVDVAPNENAADFIISVAASQDTNVTENCNAASQPEMKATPYNRNMGAKRTPFTSPTPPSNPLAAFGLRKETALEDMSKRRLDFEDTADLAASHLDLPAPVTQDAPCLQISSSSPGGPEASMKEATPEPARESLPEASASLEAPNSVEQIEMKPPQKAFNKRKKPIENRRNSLEGAGTDWNEGRRYSTRIKSRPLEWWRGERFLRGRVHKSLVTVIGIKYSSPPPCWSKRGTKAPEFKVESYVSEDYAKYVQFAALC